MCVITVPERRQASGAPAVFTPTAARYMNIGAASRLHPPDGTARFCPLDDAACRSVTLQMSVK